MTDWLKITTGDAPLIISVPHAGTIIPQGIAGFISNEQAILDADFFVDKLYAFAGNLGATIIKTDISRSVIDVNRNPDGESLYHGQSTTELCPTTSFDNSPLYIAGQEPDYAQIEHRKKQYYIPYHEQLTANIQRLRGKYENIVLYDAHSIKSCVPRFFDGELPLYNIGSNDGKSCEIELTNKIASQCPHDGFVINGRFKGGFITRHYGQPKSGVHAIQMELAMRNYINENEQFPPNWSGEYAEPCQKILKSIIAACLEFADQK